MILLIIIKLLSNFIDQKLAGGWLQDINVNALIISIVMFAIISILLILINKNIKVKQEKDKEEIWKKEVTIKSGAAEI